MTYPYIYLDSYFVSDHYKIFCDLGHPELDLVIHKDGSWSILEMLNAPVIPSMTRWNYILKNIKNQEINETFIKRMLSKIDPRSRELWDLQAKKERDLDIQETNREKHKEDFAGRAFNAIRRNPELYERVHRNGLSEIGLDKIYKNIDPWVKRRM